MAQADFSRIASNIGALNALNSLNNINAKLGVHQQRLATGKRINSAKDDPAGLTIATKMKARSEGLKVAMDNIADANNMLSVAEAGMSKITDILVTMRSKAEQAASDTLGASERAAIQSQLSSFAEQITDLVNETKWNGTQLLDGTANKRFQTGADNGEYTTWSLTDKQDATSLGVSEVVLATNVSNKVTSAGLTDAAVAATIGNLSAVKTGSYSFEVLDKAASAAVGKVNVESPYITDVSAMAAAAPTNAGTATELKSGESYTLVIDAVNHGGANGINGDVSYRIIDNTGTTVYDINNANLTGTGSSGALEATAGGDDLGVTLTLGGTGLVAGQSMNFEYIRAGAVKYELNDGSGAAMTISAGDAGEVVGTTAKHGYNAAGGTLNSGVGLQATAAAIGAAGVGSTVSFDYKEAGNFVVDVSTAIKAANYMDTVNSALDKVNASMADLGSLMARLEIKSEAVAVSQVNVEASYNRIMNADMAMEQLEATKFSILQQTSTTMLAQANTAPQGILSLFR
ncbi:MAG: flagellin [Anaerolineae bacterium]|nr:flagellin [Anaerolineae bacterium]